MRKVICLLAIEDGKILLTKKDQTWILPGGKPDFGESDLECLVRELSEELPGLMITSKFRFHSVIYGKTPHQGDVIEAAIYSATVNGELIPSREISEANWFNVFDKLNLSEITEKLIKSLNTENI